ncbi:macro domain-containing protein [Hahella aquimaris]|uniref:macro domain-containing protein n=1 Tax=Hahella sp. HNIBRBA332 TaxID=3015983 RepID=UPI00273CC79F|nr:macro domain-containing protein [Hahella sp. HNIBRBA332]WLQ15729.1 macro domain-containing protein [Hahella sp. HNIBRBA332]
MAYSLDLFYAWKRQFDGLANVEVIDGDILKQVADAIVSPANSFGYMDGGLDLKYSLHFGWELEAKVRQALESDYFGEIPVGQAIVVETDHQSIPFLISAPTMRVPMDVSQTANAYLAFKAVLQAVIRHNQMNAQGGRQIRSLLCPGLGTGEGRMPAHRCATQMRRAYEVCVKGRYITQGGLAAAVKDHMALLE